jgi:hypothetical protein
MTDYAPLTNFARKDTLPTGDSAKKVTASELDDEFVAIAAAIATKANTADVGSPVILSAQQTFTAGFGTTPITDSGSTLAIDAATSNVFIHSYTGAVSISAPTNPLAGQRIFIKFVNGVGAAAFTWNSVFKLQTTMQPTQTNGAVDIAQCVYDGTFWFTSFIGKNYV